jgi:hypothetical protein
LFILISTDRLLKRNSPSKKNNLNLILAQKDLGLRVLVLDMEEYQELSLFKLKGLWIQ